MTHVSKTIFIIENNMIKIYLSKQVNYVLKCIFVTEVSSLASIY